MRCGKAGMAGLRKVRLVAACCGRRGVSGCVMYWCGDVRLDRVRQAGRVRGVGVRYGTVWLGRLGALRRVGVRSIAVRCGRQCMVRLLGVCRGWSGFGSAGEVCRVMVCSGQVCYGELRSVLAGVDR